MPFKFEKLEVWKRSLDCIELIAAIGEQLPQNERFNLVSQINRAATSIALNIAEGSTSQTNAKQARFIGLAIRSLIETVACQHIINRRKFLANSEQLRDAYRKAEELVAMLHNLRKSIAPDQSWLREATQPYDLLDDEDASSTEP